MAKIFDTQRPFIEIRMTSGTRYVVDCELNDGLTIEKLNAHLSDKARGFLPLFLQGDQVKTSINPAQIESVKPLSE
ncbi:MAG TPA: hypothetical protein VH144_03275 [Candidatus Saccharimonadales bacterium]|jgi:hypothetical protein|nr:hypothetical protein [Candidatus Saccharimonadales bacterium]